MEGTYLPWMLVHEPANMSMSAWVGPNLIFKYFVHANRILGKYFLTSRIKSLLTWKNILPRVHGWMIIMDRNGWKRMNFILNIGNYHYCHKNLNKRNKVETIYVGFFQNNSHIKCSSCTSIFHIYVIWDIFKLCSM